MSGHEALAERVRVILTAADVAEKRMFGGICFMVRGHMTVAASPRGLLVRVGRAGYAAALKKPGTRPMLRGTTPVEGYIHVGPEGTATASALRGWIAAALAEVATLPAKSARPAKPGRSPAAAARVR